MQLSNGNVLFVVTAELQVAFYAKQANGSWGYDYTGINRITSTKFLLKCFAIAKWRYGYLWCTSYCRDGGEDYRNGIFKKLGFEDNGFYEWGFLTPEIESRIQRDLTIKALNKEAQIIRILALTSKPSLWAKVWKFLNKEISLF